MNADELKKRRRERIAILVVIAVIIALTYIESHLSTIEVLLPISNEVLIFGLNNINLILIIFLIFLISRNLTKLIFERRRGILGSKLRTKLVVAFMILSLIPTVTLFLVSIQFLSYSIDSRFDIKMGRAFNLSLEVAQDYYQKFSDNARYYALQIGSEITDNKLYEKEQAEYLKAFLTQRQRYFKLGSIAVRFDNRDEDLFLKDPENLDILPPRFSPRVLEDVFMGKDLSTVSSVGGGDVISGIAPLYSNFSPKEVIGIISVSYYIDKELIDKMSIISRTSEEYKQLKLLKNPIKISYTITLFIVTLLIIFSSMWFGLFLAKGITVPVQELAEATHEVAHGNLDYHIDVLAEDEIGDLADSFNQMTKDLKESSLELRQANIDLEQRRKYMETVLRNVSAGVVSINRNNVISTINSAAEKMLGINGEGILNRRYEDVLKPEHMGVVEELLEELHANEGGLVERQIQLIVKDSVMAILVSATILRDDENNYMGIVGVFEDITQLQKTERIAAWREAAKRIAHEIKNPLTPVKLSAERLQRKYGDKIDGETDSVFHECTKTIINQVEILKNLVNEFSQFARMPETNPSPNDLNTVIEDSVILFQDAHKEIAFDFRKDAGIPLLNIDAEQIKRVMVNLLDNAVAAVSAVDHDGKVEISTQYDRHHKRVKLDVMDNGPGISPEAKMKLFEPYFSTKKAGTGLGLVIVSSIISDHNGSVNVMDNVRGGTIVSIELPVA
ncbi:MAG: HAMP domain-containing protein [Syntrophobacterales bacterium]|nr:MAG: HAMP domain-containing protein [Syntrophobacterales bacterium]